MTDGDVLTEGTEINETYRVLNTVGGGAMARVYRVKHLGTGKLYALKVHRVTDSPEMTAELALKSAENEAKFMESLDHHTLPKMVESFTRDGALYLVMEFVEGKTLKKILDENAGQPLDVPLVVKWGLQLCNVLTYLHRQNPPIVFRDLKPTNIICRTNGDLCLIDFGIARKTGNNKAADTIIFGSPGYAPPEQYGHGETTPVADIYALGATLFHMLTGYDPSQTPFKFPLIKTKNATVPRVLDNLVMRCVEFNKERRPRNAESVAHSLTIIHQMIEKQDNAALNPGTSDLSRHPALAFLDGRTATGELTPLSSTPATFAFTPPSLITEPSISSVSASQNRNEMASYLPGSGLDYAFRGLMSGSVLLILVCAAYLLFGSQSAADPHLKLPCILLALGTIAALLFGIVFPRRATRNGMVLTILGSLLLIALSGLIFLPAMLSAFLACVVLALLMLVPATLLLAAEMA